MQESGVTIDENAKVSIPRELGILPLRDTVIFPFMITPLLVGREKSVRLINDCLAGDKIVGLVTQRVTASRTPQRRTCTGSGPPAGSTR